MEWSVPWTTLGIPPDTAFTFHVSSTNTTPGSGSYPSQVDDNMGGCGGGPASSQFADLTFSPDQDLPGIIGETIYAAHTLTNTGNGTDIFNLSSVITGSLSPTLSYYIDQDGSGTLTIGDTLLTDNDADGVSDTGALASGASIDLLIGYTFTSPEYGSISVEITATSSYDTFRAAAVTDTLTVTRPLLTILKSASTSTAAPGEVITYTVTVVNTGMGVATNVILTDRMSPYTAWALDSYGAGLPFQLIQGSPSSGLTLGIPEYSDDGGADWNYDPTSGGGSPPRYDGNVTNWRIPMTGTMNADSAAFTLQYKVKVK